MYINTTGLVLRETRYKDSSKILTVLTRGEGKLTVSARGALRRNSKLAAVTQLLAYSEMTLLLSRDKWILTEAQSVEMFQGLREDIELLSLGSYFAELTENVTDEDNPNPEILQLCLNALYLLSERKREPALVKSAFELRLIGVSGFAPLLSHCAGCGKENMEQAWLDLMGGTVRCESCADRRCHVPICKGALDAARYIADCDLKKVFAFKLGRAAGDNLAEVAEAYLTAQLDRSFKTLNFYKSVKGTQI